MMDPIDETLLWRYFDNTLTSEEKLEVESWIKSSKENKEQARKIARVYFSSGLLHIGKEVDTRQELNKFWKKLEHRKTLRIWKYSRRIAAALLLPIILFTMYTLSEKNKMGAPVQMAEVRTEVGVIDSVILSDNSIVYLNSESSLRYPLHFNQKREVHLQGEAYFVVNKHNGSQFIVSTPSGASIEVLGTEFNVISTDNQVNTTLVTGSVEFVYADEAEKKKNIRIVPGQKITYYADSRETELREVDVDAEISWKTGKAEFKDCPLVEALDILSRKFNVEFIIKNEALKEDRFTGSYKDQNLEEILNNFAISTDLKYRYVNNNHSPEKHSMRDTIEIY